MGEDPLEDLRLLDEEADQVKTRRRESGSLHVATTLGHVRATLAARSKSHLGGASPTPPGNALITWLKDWKVIRSAHRIVPGDSP